MSLEPRDHDPETHDDYSFVTLHLQKSANGAAIIALGTLIASLVLLWQFIQRLGAYDGPGEAGGSYFWWITTAVSFIAVALFFMTTGALIRYVIAAVKLQKDGDSADQMAQVFSRQHAVWRRLTMTGAFLLVISLVTAPFAISQAFESAEEARRLKAELEEFRRRVQE